MDKKLGRTEYYTKDRVYVSYTDRDVCFEELDTAEAILIGNDGVIIHNNFGEDKTAFFMKWFKDIYPTVEKLRNMEKLGLI